MDKITIAILAQGDNERLRRTLDSVYHQQNIEAYEVVLVDNGSNTPIAYSKDRYPNLKIIRHEIDTGYSVGKNTAVAHARDEYILLLDDDIVLPSDAYVNDVLHAYKKLPEIAFLGLLLVDEGKNITRYHGMEYTWYGLNFFRKSLTLEQARLKNETEIGSFHGGAVFFSRSIWDRLGGYDTYQPIMHDDFDISARAKLFGYKNYLYAENAAVHIGKQKDEDKKRFARKYSYFYSGFAGNIVKNYPIIRLYTTLFSFTAFSFFMMVALSIKKRNVYLILSFFSSYVLFIRSLKYLMHKRESVWSKIQVYDRRNSN